jgi:polysaccharide biosynthesis/export protein
MLPMVCAAWLAGCAGSSTSPPLRSTGGAGDAPYPISTGATPDDSGFAPTAAAQAADKLTSVAKVGNRSYMIGPNDVLDVSVYQVPDLTKTVQVGDDGMINYPLVGNVEAAGKTAHQVEAELQQKLGAKYLRSPQVSVFVKDSSSQRVTIEGSVKNSGVYPLKGRTTLEQVVAMAGGINMDTDSGDIVIFRTVDGKRSAARFNIDNIKDGKAEDPELQPGDVIVVDTSSTKLALSNILKILPLATTAAVFSAM